MNLAKKHEEVHERLEDTLRIDGKSIKAKLMQMVCITVTVGMTIVMAAVAVLTFMDSTKVAASSLTQLCASYSESVNDAVSLAWAMLDTYATDKTIAENAQKVSDGEMTVGQMKTYLGTLTDGSLFDTVSMTYPTGRTWDDYDLSDRAYIKSALSGKSYISSPTVSARDGVLQYFCAVPMNNGIMNGVNFAPIDGDYFSKKMQSFVDNSSYDCTYFVLDAAGKFIVHNDMTKVEEGLSALDASAGNAEYAALVSAMQSGARGSCTVTLEDGTKYLAAYAPVGNEQGWSLCLFYNQSDIHRMARFALFLQLGLIAVLILLAFIVASKRSATLVDPISSINQRLKLLAEGDTHSPIEVPSRKSEREVTELLVSLKTTTTRLNSYISDIAQVLSGLASGDFSARPQVKYAGDFAEIEQSLYTIEKELSSSFKQIVDCAAAVSGSSDVVSASSQGLAQGATEQAAAVEELAATVSGISDQASETAAKAGEVRDLTNENEKNVHGSMECMEQLKLAMEDMSVSSAQISKIVKTIDDIAFQTNILALNAAVEAARAGQQGKGFAVVADEVRNLANKSAEAAKQTQKLVSEAIDSVEHGTTIAERMNGALSLVTEKNAVIAGRIQEIADAAEIQNVSIEQVNTGIEQISVVVQTNTATAEETAAASTELNTQAEKLGETVERFRF